LDAQTLARLERIDPQLLRPIQHRSDKAQGALMVIRVRGPAFSWKWRVIRTGGMSRFESSLLNLNPP
jgi:hypothetical protein